MFLWFVAMESNGIIVDTNTLTYSCQILKVFNIIIIILHHYNILGETFTS